MIYLDNGATSYPKPPEVIDAVTGALHMAGNPGRSSHESARLAAKNMELARLEIARYLKVAKPQRIIFQPGATQAANLLLNGSLKPGEKVYLSSVEHNAVARPLSRLAKRGVFVGKIPCSPSGLINLDAAEAIASKEAPTLLVCQQGSNVAGCIQPIEELTKIAHRNNAKIVVDGSQVAGHLPLSLDDLGVDAWFCSGHKGIPGPQGVGILYKRDDFALSALIAGGTGTGDATWDENCIADPECFEAGTPPFPLILGLAAAASWLAKNDVEKSGLHEYEQKLTQYLHRGLLSIPGITVLGPDVSVPRLPLISFIAEQLSPDTIAHHLDADYGIAVRAGLHCAPDAHETLGTGTIGAVRLSLNHANTMTELDTVLAAIATIVQANERSRHI